MNIKEKALKAARWTTITTIISQIIVFFFSIIKFRLLDVEVFGIMAIVNSIILILRMFQTMGFGPAIVQKEEISDIFVNSVFWVVFCISLFFSGLLIMLSSWISRFYNLEIISILLIIASVQYVFNSFITIQNYLLSRDMELKVITLVGLVSQISSILIVIGFAIYNYGVWSLVFGSIGSNIITFFLYLKYTKWFPSLVFSLDTLKPSIRFSLALTFQKVSGIIKLNAPQLIIGKVLGTEILGLYSFAQNIILRIMKNIDAVISQVLFPMFSRLQNDKPKLVKGYLKANHYNFLLSIPILVGYLFIAKDLVGIVYGQKWLSAVTLSQILLISIIVNSIYTKGSSLITGVGRPDLLLKIDLYMFIPMMVALFITIKFGIIPFVIIVVAERCIAFGIQQMILNKIIDYKFKGLIKSLQAPFFGSLVMAIILFITRLLFPLSIDQKLLLILLIMLGGATYFLTVFYLDKKELIPTIKLLIQSR